MKKKRDRLEGGDVVQRTSRKDNNIKGATILSMSTKDVGCRLVCA